MLSASFASGIFLKTIITFAGGIDKAGNKELIRGRVQSSVIACPSVGLALPLSSKRRGDITLILR
jgi:hypothetical protein